MLTKLKAELEQLEQERRDNLYYKDDRTSVVTQYKNWNLGKEQERKIAIIEDLIRAYEDYEGSPAEWQGNEITLRICDNCPICETCKVYNAWLNRPARPHFDINGDVIEYDVTGNLKYQVINLKTGERV
jgi:hypothetical protein